MSHKYKIKSVLRSLGVVLTALANHDINELVRTDIRHDSQGQSCSYW